MQTALDCRPKLLLVDDEPTNLQVLRHILQQDYRLLYAKDGRRALELAASERPELIQLDVMMPGITGLETCRWLKADAATAAIPVIFVTALADARDEVEGFEAGAVDYITKPVSAPVVRARVRTHLSLVRMEELASTRLQIVQRLGRAAEFKDNETGLHVIRMSHYSRVLALAAGLPPRVAEDILHAAPMHDIGKIGIPDAILRKAGPLDDDEWRIVAIADVFDALTSERPYKPGWPVDKAIGALREGAGRHFDPALVELFIARLDEILQIKARWAESAAAGAAPPLVQVA